MTDLQRKANEIRIEALNMIHRANTGHTGGSLSSADILVALYCGVMHHDPAHPEDPERDRFILSKGHSVEAYLCLLADQGYFPREFLQTFSQYGSKLIGHPNNRIPGIEICSGALGHGLSIGAGMALGAKLRGKNFRTFVLMGDGELAEGSVWEAAMSAAHYKLDGLYAIIDRNRLQISGSTEDVMALESLPDKWSSFNWDVEETDGHDIANLIDTVAHMGTRRGKPHLIIANTIKGKGVPFMEGVAKWHHGVPTDEQLAQAVSALRAAYPAPEHILDQRREKS